MGPNHGIDNLSYEAGKDRVRRELDDMKRLFTTLGSFQADELGLILPHEPVFVDLRTPDHRYSALADTDQMLKTMVPELQKARAAGVSAMIDCTPIGVSR